MIIVKIMGQLGNQLFIYAMARSIQQQYGDEKIYIDLSGLKRHYYTAQYKLDQYELPSDIISYDISKIGGWTRVKYHLYTKVFHLEQKIQRVIRKNKQTSLNLVKRWMKRGCYFDFNRNWTDYCAVNAKTKIIYGYFQSDKYFASIKDILLKDFRIKNSLNEKDKEIYDLIKSTNSVGISIRMINNFKNVQGYLDIKYYLDGIKKICELVENPCFFVFADNLEAVKDKINFPVEVTFVSPSNAVVGLFLLSKCNHFVIANSTFSWWGAYLSENKGKRIVVPDPWDKDGEYRKDIYFENCIRIPSVFSEEITE